MSAREVKDRSNNAILRLEKQKEADISSIKINQELQTLKIFDNKHLEGSDSCEGDGSYITSAVIEIDKRTINKLTILIISDGDCSDLAVAYRISMDNINYFPLNRNFLNRNFSDSYDEGNTIQAVIKDFIPRYMQIKIINSGGVGTNITGYVNY